MGGDGLGRVGVFSAYRVFHVVSIGVVDNAHGTRWGRGKKKGKKGKRGQGTKMSRNEKMGKKTQGMASFFFFFFEKK